MWTQIVGKVRLAEMPWINHSWQVTLYVSSRGLTTRAIPVGSGNFQIDFDFIAHELIVTASAGKIERMKLYARSVASFYSGFIEVMERAGLKVNIYPKPNEVDPSIPFIENEIQKAYDQEEATRFWRVLVAVNNVFTEFRAQFNGKASPVHFFWGGFDLAVTFFSGRKAPLHPGGMPNMPLPIMQEAYSHEVASVGFWPGNDMFPKAAFYAYTYPTPAEYGRQPVAPNGAFFSEEMGEFLLLYDEVLASANPEESLMEFLNSTFRAAEKTGNWPNYHCDFDNLKPYLPAKG